MIIQLEEAKQKLSALKELIEELSESMGVPAAREWEGKSVAGKTEA